MDRGRLVSILIASSSFLCPLCYTHWSSMFLEFFGRWVVFPWWVYDIWSHTLWLLTPWSDVFWNPFDLLWTVPVLYTAMAVALVLNNESFCRRRHRWDVTLLVRSIVLIVQIVWPTLLFLVFVEPDIGAVLFIPLPVSPVVALIGLTWMRAEPAAMQS